MEVFLEPLVSKHQCYFCNISEPLQATLDIKRFRKLIEIHHICEKNQNGTNEDYNLVPVCSNCHSKIHLGLIQPIKWYFTSGGWQLEWLDVNNTRQFGKPKVSINT